MAVLCEICHFQHVIQREYPSINGYPTHCITSTSRFVWMTDIVPKVAKIAEELALSPPVSKEFLAKNNTFIKAS